VARVDRIVSGGQTGADQGALEAARRLGIPTGGWMPKGFMTEAGRRPEFAARYGMREHPRPDYTSRTEANVTDSDGTLIFGDVLSPGSRDTRAFCAEHDKPCLVVPWRPGRKPPPRAVADVRRWLERHAIRVLNVAGNRESVQPGIEEAARDFLASALASA